MSLAIAHAMKKRAKKMAKGGEVEHHSDGAGGSANRAKGAARVRNEERQSGVHKSQSVHVPGSSQAGYSARGGSTYTPKGVSPDAFHKDAKAEHHKVLNEMRDMPNPKLKGLAEGGMVEDGYQSECTEHCEYPCMVHPEFSGYESMPKDEVKHNEPAMEEDDMVGRIMKSRDNMYAKGGKVEHEKLADFDENDFEQHPPDEFDFHDTAENSGDEDGNEFDADHDDMVAKIMMKRRKQKNPSPA